MEDLEQGRVVNGSQNPLVSTGVPNVEHTLAEHEVQQCQGSDVTVTKGNGLPLERESARQAQEEDGLSEATSTTSTASTGTGVLDMLRYIGSFALLGFSIAVLSAAIFTKQTTATGENNIHPALAFAIFWVLLIWLSYLEGGLNCMVGLKPLNRNLYQASHRFTYKCTSMAHKGDNLDRFIVGRQYLDLSIVFITSFMVSSIDGAQVLGLPRIVNDIFLGSGLAVTLITIVCGQLVAQINAATYMLDFVNTRILWFSTFVALCVEASGILHSVYLIQIFFSKLSRKPPIESNEPARSTGQKIFFWGRVVFSLILLLGSIAVTLTALFQGKTTMWKGIPAYGSLLVLIALIAVGGLMEGLQIALMAVIHLPQDTLEHSPTARKNCDYLFQGTRVEAFLIGRQILQTVIMFVIARITTVDVSKDEENLLGVSDWLQNLFGSGVLGALISTIIASLAWRVIASSFPLAFLANPFASCIIRVCLAVEWTGVCYSAWLFAYLQRKAAGFQKDEVYVGTAEQRDSEGNKEDNDLEVTVEGSSFDRETTEGTSSDSSQE